MNNAIIDMARATIREFHRQQPMWDGAETERLRALAWKSMVIEPPLIWLRATAQRLRMERHLRHLRSAAQPRWPGQPHDGPAA